MNRFAYAQDILKNSAGSVGAGFNRRIGGQSFADAFQHENERLDQNMVAGFYKADEMIEAGEIFYVHNFHQLECPSGHAFLYGGTYACNTCNRDHLDKEWWKVKVMRDGSSWCCVGNGFINLQESDNFAFGDTREQAIQAYGELMLAKERAVASPVQGAASASESTCPKCGAGASEPCEFPDLGSGVSDVCEREDVSTSATTDQGAAVKPWDQRIRHSVDVESFAAIDAAKNAEIAELRAALAERAQAAQPEAPALTQQGRDFDVEQSARALEAMGDTELAARLRHAWRAQAAQPTSAVGIPPVICVGRRFPITNEATVFFERDVSDEELLALNARLGAKLNNPTATPAPEQEAAPCPRCPIKTAYGPAKCFDCMGEQEAAQAERDKLRKLVYAASAVIERWDSPKWKDEPHTGEFIHRLRAAVAEASSNSVAPVALPGAQEQEIQLELTALDRELWDAGYADTGIMRGRVAKLRTLYTAPVPATTPAEQPEGDSSHVMRLFGAPAGQHDSEEAAWEAHKDELRALYPGIAGDFTVVEVVINTETGCVVADGEYTVALARIVNGFLGSGDFEKVEEAIAEEIADAPLFIRALPEEGSTSFIFYESGEREDVFWNKFYRRATATNTNPKDAA